MFKRFGRRSMCITLYIYTFILVGFLDLVFSNLKCFFFFFFFVKSLWMCIYMLIRMKRVVVQSDSDYMMISMLD